MSNLGSYFEVIINGLPLDSRIGVWCELNRHKWPSIFAKYEPDGWELMSNREKNEMPIYCKVWEITCHNLPHKMAMRELKKQEGMLDDSDFDEWYSEIFNK
jgi:hypothetical protein